MAFTLKRLVEEERLTSQTGFGGTGTAYVAKKVSEDKARTSWWIEGSGAPSTDYNAATLGSIYIDLDGVHIYIMTAAATWTKVSGNT